MSVDECFQEPLVQPLEPASSFAADPKAVILPAQPKVKKSESYFFGESQCSGAQQPRAIHLPHSLCSSQKLVTQPKEKDNGKIRTCAPEGIWIATRRVNHSATLSCFNVEIWLIMSNISRKCESMSNVLAVKWKAFGEAEDVMFHSWDSIRRMRPQQY